MLCRVDLADVFTGRRSARWALEFVGHVFEHPESITRAKHRGGQHWRDWYGWSTTAARVVQNSNVTIAAAGGKATMDGPRTETTLAPNGADAMEVAYAQLMS